MGWKRPTTRVGLLAGMIGMGGNGDAVIDPVDRVLATAEAIKPLLAGLGPEVQGAILAELVSIWLRGHIEVGASKHGVARRHILKLWADTVLQLTELGG